MTAPQRVAVFGSTGSIGVSTLDVIARHPERFEVVALSAHTNIARLREQCLAHRPGIVIVSSAADGQQLAGDLRNAGLATEVRWSPASSVRPDCVRDWRRRRRASGFCSLTRKRW